MSQSGDNPTTADARRRYRPPTRSSIASRPLCVAAAGDPVAPSEGWN
jgi:hypothetical protein